MILGAALERWVGTCSCSSKETFFWIFLYFCAFRHIFSFFTLFVSFRILSNSLSTFFVRFLQFRQRFGFFGLDKNVDYLVTFFVNFFRLFSLVRRARSSPFTAFLRNRGQKTKLSSKNRLFEIRKLFLRKLTFPTPAEIRALYLWLDMISYFPFVTNTGLWCDHCGRGWPLLAGHWPLVASLGMHLALICSWTAGMGAVALMPLLTLKKDFYQKGTTRITDILWDYILRSKTFELKTI